MKKSNLDLELEEIESEMLNSEEIKEFKNTLELDAYYEDYVSYERDLTELIKDKR